MAGTIIYSKYMNVKQYFGGCTQVVPIYFKHEVNYLGLRFDSKRFPIKLYVKKKKKKWHCYLRMTPLQYDTNNNENHSKSKGNAILHLVWEKCHVPGTRITNRNTSKQRKMVKIQRENLSMSVCCRPPHSCVPDCVLCSRTKLNLQIMSRWFSWVVNGQRALTDRLNHTCEDQHSVYQWDDDDDLIKIN